MVRVALSPRAPREGPDPEERWDRGANAQANLPARQTHPGLWVALFRCTTKPKPQPGEQPSRGFGASHEGRSLQKGPSTNTNIHFWRSQVRPVVSPWLTFSSGSARGSHDLGTSLDEGNAAAPHRLRQLLEG